MAAKSPKLPLLFYANPETDADLLYFGGFSAPDPFLALGHGRHRVAVLSDLEFGRARKASAFTDIRSLSDLTAATTPDPAPPGSPLARIVRHLAAEFDLTAFAVSRQFPLGLAREIEELGLALHPADGPFLPARQTKSDAEAAAIAQVNKAVSGAFGLARQILRAATIGPRNVLQWQGKPLTSERLRTALEIFLLERDCKAENTIVAGGDQACDPHERGHGPLRAHELIIIDIFPRHRRTHFYGDMTRTFLKGRANPAQRDLVAAVKAAQDLALAALRPGVTGKSVHESVQQHFRDLGFETKRTEDGFVGFFHGTGHGLGLEIHEPPRVNAQGGKLAAGMVVTVEPGLYYPGLGGCRIEDVIRLTPGGSESLSRHPYSWIIP